MKYKAAITSPLLVLLALGLHAEAGLFQADFNAGFYDNGQIPDGSAAGWSDSRTISLPQGPVSGVTVRLNVAGGYNGDLYGYLRHGTVMVPLVNRVGVTATSPASSYGYSDSGFTVTLTSIGTDVHLYGRSSPVMNGDGQLTGAWQADGRLLDPESSPSAFDSAPRATLADFNGLDPNGTWTLFFADVSSGAQSQVMGWGLDISTVPEPVNVALGIFGGLLLAWRMAGGKIAGNRSNRGSPESARPSAPRDPPAV